MKKNYLSPETAINELSFISVLCAASGDLDNNNLNGDNGSSFAPRREVF